MEGSDNRLGRDGNVRPDLLEKILATHTRVDEDDDGQLAVYIDAPEPVRVHLRVAGERNRVVHTEAARR